MRFHLLQFFLVFLLGFRSCSVILAQQCQPPKYSEYGYALLSSAYLVLSNEDLGSCYLKCVQDQNCSSINYDLTNGKCEHNFANKKVFQSLFVKKKQSVYAETREPGLSFCHNIFAALQRLLLFRKIY